MKNILNVIPHASSLIESMRSIGYSFETALADIIDNSISARADKISIYQREFDGKPYVQVIDNGLGMDNEEIVEAMRLGSKNPLDQRGEDDLGRFGLGLKSASFSQCRVLKVISKKNGQINGYEWDLDLIQRTNMFSVRKLTKQNIKNLVNISELKEISHGTIIHWENFDRISESTNDLTQELADLMTKMIEHISLIFHRYIESGLDLSVNYESVLPKDPFLETHAGTQELQSKTIIIDNKQIHLQPFVLPHYSRLTATDKRSSGKTNEQFQSQGFYLYRNKRLIVWGDYFKLTKKTELGKNVRIKVDIPNSLDYIWEIDVKKSRANVPSKIKKNLLSAISDGESISRKVNTYRGKKETTKEKAIWNLYKDREENFYFEVNKENDLYKQFSETLDEYQEKLFTLLLKSLASNIPVQTIYAQIGNGNEYIHKNDDSIFNSLMEMITEVRKNDFIDVKLLLHSLLSEEPYSSDKSAVDFINEELRKE